MSKSLQAITDKLLVFRRERDWEQFHTHKDLAISIVLEAAELLEEFQWKNDGEIKRYLQEGGLSRVSEEIADIAIYVAILSHDLGIDLLEEMEKKIRKNEEKYPVGKSKGSAKKYDKL
ncbi:MAG: nucleotide pyrophosphohydrolase [Dissulfurispiraceae bacterium]|jgi:NTP pyrophosphatase (non-canonical NTP hydrolase)